MGYTTEFSGSIKVEPPLNEAEIEFLTQFSGSRRMNRKRGPYYCEHGKPGYDPNGDGWGGGKQAPTDDIIDSNHPPEGQPGLWCKWVPDEDGTYIEWDGGEKFYESEAWMRYVIDHFLKPGCLAKTELPFLQGNHICNGVIKAQGEDMHDRWKLIVKNNKVSTKVLE